MECKLYAFCDSGWGNDKDTRRSVTGYVIFMNGNPMSWVSRSQKNSFIGNFSCRI